MVYFRFIKASGLLLGISLLSSCGVTGPLRLPMSAETIVESVISFLDNSYQCSAGVLCLPDEGL